MVERRVFSIFFFCCWKKMNYNKKEKKGVEKVLDKKNSNQKKWIIFFDFFFFQKNFFVKIVFSECILDKLWSGKHKKKFLEVGREMQKLQQEKWIVWPGTKLVVHVFQMYLLLISFYFLYLPLFKNFSICLLFLCFTEILPFLSFLFLSPY